MTNIGYVTQYSSFTNSNVNNNRAENVSGFSNPQEVKTLEKDSQAVILADFLNDFDNFEVKQAGDHDYFTRINDDGTQEFYRVVDDGGENKIIHTTVKNGEVSGETGLYEITKADELNNWNSDETLDKYLAGETVEDFEMFDASDKSQYLSNIKQFAQEYIDKYDSNGDGVWSEDEFATMAHDNVEGEVTDEHLALYSQLFNDFQMDEESDNINAGEFASQLMMGDLDWESFAAGADAMDVLDGKLDFYNYNSVAADPFNETYQSELAIRTKFYDAFFAE